MLYINNKPIEYISGMAAGQLLDETNEAAIQSGDSEIRNASGEIVAITDAVYDGERYFIVKSGANPPSVDACLKDVQVGLNRDFVRYLVRAVLDEIRSGVGVASVGYVVYRITEEVEKKDSSVVLGYLTNDNYDCRSVAGVTADTLGGLLPGGTGVIAVRDVITMSNGNPVTELFITGDLNEVGTTNKVRIEDYFKEKYDVLVSARTEGFAIKGFTAQPDYAELFGKCRESSVSSVMVVDGFSLFSGFFAEIIDAQPGVIVLARPPELGSVSLVLNRLEEGATAEYSIDGISGENIWAKLTDNK